MARALDVISPALFEARKAEVKRNPAIWAAYLRDQRNWLGDELLRALDADYRTRNFICVPGHGESVNSAEPNYLDWLERTRSIPIPSRTCFEQEMPQLEKANFNIWIPRGQRFIPANTKRDDKLGPDGRLFCVALANPKAPITKALEEILNQIEDALNPPDKNGIANADFSVSIQRAQKFLRDGKRVEAADEMAGLKTDLREQKRPKSALPWRLRSPQEIDEKARKQLSI